MTATERPLSEEIEVTKTIDTSTLGLAGAIGDLVDLAAHAKRLEDELDRAFQVLAALGVPKERARSVGNGIMVLDQRCARELAAAEFIISRAREVCREYEASHPRLYCSSGDKAMTCILAIFES